MSAEVDRLVKALGDGERQPIYLIVGDLVLSEPAGVAIAGRLSELLGCSVESVRRPDSLGTVLDDLRTYSLFDSGKVRLVIESALLADRNAAAGLIDLAGEVLPVEEGADLTGKQRQGATRLLQALRVFGIAPDAANAQAVLQELPDWAFLGGPAERKKRNGRARGKKQVADLRAGLEVLLRSAIDAGMIGWADSDLSVLGEVLQQGLPEGHHLVLVESAAAADHPLVAELRAKEALLQVGSVSIDRRGDLDGLGEMVTALHRETGVEMRHDAASELAQRTLRKNRVRGASATVDPESTGRFAAEYRKLAMLSEGRPIDRELVERTVEDRGEEDVFKLLDEISSGDVTAALRRLDRHLTGADDAGAATFGFFSLLAGYALQIATIRGQLEVLGARTVERNYKRFQSNLASRLQEEILPGVRGPLAGMHPFRLHRVYLAAVRWSSAAAKRLPDQVLAAEMRLKGDSASPETVLTEFVVRLAMASVRGRLAGRR